MTHVTRHLSASLRMLADVADALSEPRGRSYWCAPDEIPITAPGGEPVGAFVWDSQNVVYRYVPANQGQA